MVVPETMGRTLPAGAVPEGFTSPAMLMTWAPGEWALLAPLNYYPLLDPHPVVVPRRFITDLASIPQVAQAVLPVDDETRLPAILHDWLYCTQDRTREEADALFLEALERAGVGLVKRQAMYRAVRAGGWRYWNSRTGLTDDDFALW